MERDVDDFTPGFREFYEGLKGRNGSFHGDEMEFYVRQGVRQRVEGAAVYTMNLADLWFEPPMIGRLQGLLAAVRAWRNPSDPRTHLLVSGYIQPEVAAWFEQAAGWTTIPIGYEKGYVCDLRSPVG
jgi:hypothetical protein